VPRSATSTELTVLGLASRSIKIDTVEIQNIDGTWKALTNLSGTGFSNLDFVIRGSITDDSDAPTWTGSIELAKSLVAASGASISIAPLVESSPANVDDSSAYAPLIDGMRRIRCYGTTARLDGTDSSQHKMFDGYVVAVSMKKTITLQIADLGHKLLTKQVEDERVYGSDAGDAMETVMQQILDDNLGTGAVTLVVDAAIVTAGVKLKKFNFQRPRLLTGLRDLAINTIGANVRYMWNSSDDMELRLFLPPRGNTTPDFTFSADNYDADPDFDINTDDVRNKGRCYFRDQQKKVVSYVAADVPDSITRYTERYFEFKEAATSQIDTPAEAKTFLDTALADLAFPKAEKRFTTLFAWAFHVYDLFELVANGDQYTTNQLQAVQRITHTWGKAKETRTAFETRGTVAGFTKNWIIREGEGPKAPEVDSLFLALGMGVEATMYGGELWDGETNGCVWPAFFAGKNIRRIHIWARENAPGTLVPEWPPVGSDAFKAGTIERPEGRLSTEGNYVWPGDATPVDGDPYNGIKFWRCFQPIPTGRNGQAIIRTVIVKPETFDGTFGDELRLVGTTVDTGSDPGDFTDLSVTRIDATTVQVDWAVSVSTGAIYILRDGVNIDSITLDGPTSGSWTDPDLHAQKTYRYSVFRISNSQSGPRTLVTIDPWGTAFTVTAETSFTLPGPRVKIDKTGVPGGTDHIEVQKSKDSGRYDPWSVSAILDPADFPYYDAIVKAGQYYRLVAYDASNVELDATLPVFWRSPLPLVTGPA